MAPSAPGFLCILEDPLSQATGSPPCSGTGFRRNGALAKGEGKAEIRNEAIEGDSRKSLSSTVATASCMWLFELKLIYVKVKLNFISSATLDTFQALNSDVWLVAAILDSSDPGHFHQDSETRLPAGENQGAGDAGSFTDRGGGWAKGREWDTFEKRSQSPLDLKNEEMDTPQRGVRNQPPRGTETLGRQLQLLTLTDQRPQRRSWQPEQVSFLAKGSRSHLQVRNVIAPSCLTSRLGVHLCML